LRVDVGILLPQNGLVDDSFRKYNKKIKWSAKLVHIFQKNS